MSAHGGGVPFGDAARDTTASYYVGRHRPEPLDDEAGWEPEYVPPCEDYDPDHREAPDG